MSVLQAIITLSPQSLSLCCAECVSVNHLFSFSNNGLFAIQGHYGRYWNWWISCESGQLWSKDDWNWWWGEGGQASRWLAGCEVPFNAGLHHLWDSEPLCFSAFYLCNKVPVTPMAEHHLEVFGEKMHPKFSAWPSPMTSLFSKRHASNKSVFCHWSIDATWIKPDLLAVFLRCTSHVLEALMIWEMHFSMIKCKIIFNVCSGG